MKLTGYLLDAHIHGDRAILWFKTEDGKAVKLVDSYTPDFYVKLRDGSVPEEVATTVREHPHILDACVEGKYLTVTESKKTRLIHITVDSAWSFRNVLRDLERLGTVAEWFNVDILHVQRYFFAKSFAPTQRLEVEYDSDGTLRHVIVLNDDMEIRPPPFTSIIFRLDVQSEKLSPDPENDPVTAISILDDNSDVQKVFKGDEKHILENFAENVQKLDPDFLVASECDEMAFPYLSERSRRKSFNLELGREPVKSASRGTDGQRFPGRVTLELGYFCEEGVAGVVEKSRFAVVPPGLAFKWAAGRIIDSRQCYEAVRKGILIPKIRSYLIYEVSAKDLIFMDRGGLILSPVVGLHENVAALDFESMFPNILIEHNISYETVTSKGIDSSRRGFLGEFTKHFLDRRLYFKHLRKKFPAGSQKWTWCDQRQSALKQILVCIYGFSGCDVNRYGSVYTYSKINEVSRELLVKALNICGSSGYRVVYADCDSVFVQREGASKKDYEQLAEHIQRGIGLPIALDQHFKFLVLMTQEADPNIEAMRHYFGKLMDGELFYRGIELRRRDYPPFLKKFETNLLGILFDADRREDVGGKQYEKARQYVVESLDELASGEVSSENLVITKILRQPVDSYRSMSPHVSAAIQLIQKGKRLQERRSPWGGQPIDFVYMNAEHPNPLRRVMPTEFINGDHRYYDRDKYREMLLDVAETVLGWNGFRREDLGFKAGQRSFLEELSGESRQEILREIKTLEEEEGAWG